MRGRGPRPRPLSKRESARNCSGQDDRELWRRNPARGPHVQAGGAGARFVLSRGLSYIHAGSRDLCRNFKATRLHSPRSSRFRGITTGYWRWRSRSSPCALPTSTMILSEPPFARRCSSRSDEVSLRLIADGNRDLLGIPTDRGLAGDEASFRGSLTTSRIVVQGRVRVRYGNASMGCPNRPCVPAAALGASFPGPAQDLSFPRVVPRLAGRSFRKCCWTRAVFPGLTSNEKGSSP